MCVSNIPLGYTALANYFTLAVHNSHSLELKFADFPLLEGPQSLPADFTDPIKS